MIRSIYCPSPGIRQTNLSLEQMRQALQSQTGLLWVSLECPTEKELQTILADVFNFHPLAIEDCMTAGYQPPKIDDFGAYLFIIIHALKLDLPIDHDDTIEFDCFLGKNFLVSSYHKPDLQAVQEVWQQLQRDDRPIGRGPDLLCHALLDRIVDAYMPIIDALDHEIDRLEDQVLTEPSPSTLSHILELRHSVMTLRRIVTPEREVMNRLSRDALPLIRPESRIYYRDIYDHLVRMHDLSESVRDVIGGTLETYLSVESKRLNEVMKTLTIVSTIFLPLTFIAGVYGMNFNYMPELGWPYGYFMTWGIFIAVAASMIWFFRRKGWL